MSGSASRSKSTESWWLCTGIVIGVIVAVAVAIRREEVVVALRCGARPAGLRCPWLTRFGSAGTYHRPRSHYRSRSRVR